MAKARVAKFTFASRTLCTILRLTDYPPNWRGQGHVTTPFLNLAPITSLVSVTLGISKCDD